jgi:hypothetical protein
MAFLGFGGVYDLAFYLFDFGLFDALLDLDIGKVYVDFCLIFHLLGVFCYYNCLYIMSNAVEYRADLPKPIFYIFMITLRRIINSIYFLTFKSKVQMD